MSQTNNFSTFRVRARRICVLAMASCMLVSGLSLANPGTAHAAYQYVECPEIGEGVGCGFEGFVGFGAWIIGAEYRLKGGGYDREIQVDWCSAARCPVFAMQAENPDRTPAGFEVTSDTPLTVTRRFTKP